jgi:hypothetical protein
LRHVHSNAKISLVVVLALLVIAGCAPLSSAAPITTLTISEPTFGTSTTYVNALTAFSLQTDTPGSTTWYKWDSYNYTKYTGPFTAVVELASTGGAPALPIDLEEGQHTLYYNSTDSAGSSELPKSKVVTMDNTAPTSQIRYSGATYSGTREYITLDTHITLISTDSGSGISSIHYRIDALPEETYTEPFTLPGPGAHAVAYHGIDNLNNSESEKSIGLFADNEAPIVTISPQQPFITSGGTIYATSTTLFKLEISDDSGIAQSSYMTDYGTWTPYTTPFTVWVSGEHTIKAMATDNLGLTSPEVTITVYIDTAPPLVSIKGETGTDIEVKKGDAIEFISSDSGVGQNIIYYSLDEGNSWNEYTSPIEINEEVTIIYYAKDGLGNTAVQTTATVKLVSSNIWTTTNLMILWLVVGVTIIIVIYIYYRRLPDDPEKEEKKEKEKIKKDETKPKKKKIRRNN